MDKKTLKKYRSNKDRLIRIEERIQELCEREPTVVMGKVTGSSADFPYTEVRTSVQMYDPYEEENVRRQIRRKESDRLRILKEQTEFPTETLIRYMDETGIRKRRAAKRWTRSKEVEWEGLCKQLRRKNGKS